MHAKIHANEDRFLMSTLWPAWQALIGEGEGGIQAREREGRARGKISPRAAIPLSLFSFSLIFCQTKNIYSSSIYYKKDSWKN